MDSRITKKRLSDYFSYQWIFVLVMCAVAIIVWELAYTIGSVRLTVGQHFKFYFDKTVWSGSTSEFYQLFKDEDTFSYDVLSLDNEAILEANDILSTRLYIQEGDILITNSLEPTVEEKEKGKIVIAKSRIDHMKIYPLHEMNIDAKAYLYDFLNNDLKTTAEQKIAEYKLEQATEENKSYFKEENSLKIRKEKANAFNLAISGLNSNYDNLDQVFSEQFSQSKISKNFRSRMKKDNRFRKEDDIQKGIKQETARIKKLVKEVLDFDKVLQKEELLYKYTKYSQAVEEYAEDDYYSNEYFTAREREKKLGRENAAYGINVAKLNLFTNTEKAVTTKYFQLANLDPESVSSDNVVMMAFNFRSYQPDLQFECISFMNAVVRACSIILD